MNDHSETKPKSRKRVREQETSQEVEPVVAEKCNEQQIPKEQPPLECADIAIVQEIECEEDMEIEVPDVEFNEEEQTLLKVEIGPEDIADDID
ncbi:putative G antigen family E member 3 [Oryctolagus cuniculus]|uniref:putative G antigen family E member 3 n=1 Tax=Oryctolagus cuniculus TaxID=9986 RepID=UPI0004911B31|nr:putative G antigen family E member 3 [Oryctolagus cuniculus]